MTLEQLRIFVAVAEREHVTAAARALHLTQSAVSNALAALEARHGVRLFDRVGRGVALNEVGRAFLPEAKAVLARSAAAEAALADMGSLRRGRLPLFASQTISGYWLPTRLVRFHAAHPGVELDVSVGNTEEAARAVLDGGAELGFVEGVVRHDLLRQEVVGVDRMAVLVAPDHPWARSSQLTREALRQGAWVLRERGSGTRSTLESAVCGKEGEGLEATMTLPSNAAVLAAAEAGAGVTALSESVAADSLRAGRLVRAPFELPAREFRLLTHAARYRSRAAEAFIAAL